LCRLRSLNTGPTTAETLDFFDIAHLVFSHDTTEQCRTHRAEDPKTMKKSLYPLRQTVHRIPMKSEKILAPTHSLYISIRLFTDQFWFYNVPTLS
jgi:hypothetical protein